jgi:tetratricopeptide (TPR) repeat protein
VLRRVLAMVVVLACAGVVVAYQATRPDRAPADPRVFVPSPRFFQDFSPSFRTSIADAYYLNMVQYYGEHVEGDGRLDSLPAMVDLVTTLSPHFTRAYLFGAFALVDAGRTDAAYAVLERGFKANPDDWRFPAYLAYFAYSYAQNEDKDLIAARWYEKAAAIPGSPAYLPRLAAALLSKGGDDEKAILMWGQAYLAGDKYARRKAVDGLERILPEDKEARMKAVAPLYQTMPRADFEALVAALFKDYVD